MTSLVLSWLSIMAERISAAVISLNLVAISLFRFLGHHPLQGSSGEAMLYCNSNTAPQPHCRRA